MITMTDDQIRSVLLVVRVAKNLIQRDADTFIAENHRPAWSDEDLQESSAARMPSIAQRVALDAVYYLMDRAHRSPERLGISVTRLANGCSVFDEYGLFSAAVTDAVMYITERDRDAIHARIGTNEDHAAVDAAVKTLLQTLRAWS